MFNHRTSLAAPAIPVNPANRLSGLFGLGTAPPSNRPLEVGLGVIGRGHAGKTAPFRAIYRCTLQNNLPSQLQFDVDSPLGTARLVHESRATIELLRQRGLTQTLEAEELSFRLFQAESQRAVFRFREVVGQILTHTTDASPPEQKKRYADYVAHLAEVDVQWVVVSCPPRQSSPADLARYEDDLLLTKSYLREALRCRTNCRPSSVAFVLTKLDTLFDSPEDAQSQLGDEQLVDSLRPLADMVQGSDRVAHAAIFPVSAFGFGNSVARPSEGARNGRAAADAEDQELEWILKPGAALTPFNLTPLVVWSLLHGMIHQEVDVDEDEQPLMADICRMLAGDLQAVGSWQVPLKGRLA